MTFSSTADRAGSETWLCSIDGNIVGDRAQHEVHHNEVQAKHVGTAAELDAARVGLVTWQGVVEGYKEFVRALEQKASDAEADRDHHKSLATRRSVRSKAATNLANAYMRHRFEVGDTDEAFRELELRTEQWRDIALQSDAGITRDYDDALTQLAAYKAKYGSINA